MYEVVEMTQQKPRGPVPTIIVKEKVFFAKVGMVLQGGRMRYLYCISTKRKSELIFCKVRRSNPNRTLSQILEAFGRPASISKP